MKISPTGRPSFIQPNLRAGKAAAYSGLPAGTGRDEVTLSEDALSFSKVFAAARDAAFVTNSSAQRLTELKTRIDSGMYSVGSDTLADSILGELYG